MAIGGQSPSNGNAASRPTVEPFNRLTARYDAWFDSPQGGAIFAAEVACLDMLMPSRRDRWLEVGVGTGRFVAALGVTEGVDPSEPMLAIAAARGILTRKGTGEHLPYHEKQFDGVLMVVTLCFLTDPLAALRECARVLSDDGHLLVGFVPADSAWGQLYRQKGRHGHPFYATARFYTADQVIRTAAAAEFRLERAASCLFSPPEASVDGSHHQGISADAGFIALSFVKTTPRDEDHGL